MKSAVNEGITFIEGRSVAAGERVEVYYNLHKGGFSIKSIDKHNKDKSKVIGYSDNVTIINASFHVNNNKLQWIYDNTRKAVYAVVRGFLVDTNEKDKAAYFNGYINPYVSGSFIDYDSKEALTVAAEVYFNDKYFYYKKER